jgi:hypothetical protein
MPFTKMTVGLPPRQWAVFGAAGTGKSTLAMQLTPPLLVVDSDHRAREVVGLALGDVYELSERPADNVQPVRIASLLRQNMEQAQIRTVIVDSLSAIIVPLVTQAILDNDAGENKNRVAAFKAKALGLRLLQDTITGYGCDVCWIYHSGTGLDGQAKQRETTSITAVELARLRRSLNMSIRIIDDGGRRGAQVEWARRGRQFPEVPVLWDSSGRWLDMPARLEASVYGGLSAVDMDAIATAIPTSFNGPEDAIAWAWDYAGERAFKDAVHTKLAYEKLKEEAKPTSAGEMWAAWTCDIQRRIEEAGIKSDKVFA